MLSVILVVKVSQRNYKDVQYVSYMLIAYLEKIHTLINSPQLFTVDIAVKNNSFFAVTDKSQIDL